VIEKIRSYAKNEAIGFTHHARIQMYKRKIEASEVLQCLVSGKIIEEDENLWIEHKKRK